MSEQQEQQPVILTIDDQEYDVNELGNDTKVHYVQVVNLRKQLADLQNQIAAAQQQSINLQVALGFRENALRESIQVVEEPEEKEPVAKADEGTTGVTPKAKAEAKKED